MPDEIKETTEMKTPETEKQETPMEQEQRVRKLVEEKPIMGGQEEEKKPDISALIEAEVKARVAGIEIKVSELRSELEVRDAENKALKERLSALEGVEALKEPLERIRAAVERTAAVDQASIERVIIPERERPKTKEGWAELVRKELTILRDRGESPYAPVLWGERFEMKRILESIPTRDWENISGKDWQKFRGDLEGEIWVIQKEDALATQYSQRSNTVDGLKELVEIAPVGNVILDPKRLELLSHLPATEIPKYLEAVIPEKERHMSMITSRALHLYTKFFGPWAEAVAEELDKPGGIEDQGRRKWENGDFGKDKREWESWVGEQIQGDERKGIELKDSTIEKTIKAKKQAINNEVLERLGFGGTGVVPYPVLKEIFKRIPEEVLGEEKYKNLKQKIEQAREVGGLSLLELLDKNMFCHSVNAAESRYTQWLVSMLAGSEYAGESALRFLRYTGESGEMNTTHIPGTWAADAFTRIPWTERRRLAEARKRRAGGPRITLGRYKFSIEREGKERGLCHSWAREAEVKINGKKKKIIELLRGKNVWFHEIPWEQLDRGSYVNDFLLPLSHSVAVFRAVTNPNIELTGREGLLSQAGALEALNKSFQYAFNDWERGQVVFAKEEGTGWEKRERWASEWLQKIKKPGGLAQFSKQEWSPWSTFAVGLIFEHHPERRLPDRELQSPTKIEMTRKIPLSRCWNKDSQKLSMEGRILNIDSVSDFLSECVDSGFLTSNEAELVKLVCKL